jgi:hypothetical protein
MQLLASFSYDIPPEAVNRGLVVAAVAVIFLASFRSMLIGFLGGLVSCAAIGYFVINTGKGDMRELMLWFGVPTWSLAGALAATTLSGLVKLAAKRLKA